jgi:hypothetical protein
LKRWAVLVVLIYFLALLALTGPLFVVCFYPHVGARELASVMSDWGYWAWMGVMLAGQARPRFRTYGGPARHGGGVVDLGVCPKG